MPSRRGFITIIGWLMLLRVEDLKKSFSSPGGGIKPIIEVERFGLDVNERVVIQGPSGSGKSTFLNCLIGFHRSDAGRIYFQDTDLCEETAKGLDSLRASKIGFLRQRPALFAPLTVAEHLQFACRLAAHPWNQETLLSAAESISLADHLGYRPAQLSLGQQQRLGLGCVMVREPMLILADEPTAHLDREATTAVLDLLVKASEERSAALLMVTHDSEVAKRFEHRVDWSDLNRAVA